MKISRFVKFLVPALGAGVLAACAAEPAEEAPAAAGPEPAVIAERHDNFEAIGDSFKAIRTQLESGSPDTAIILTAATDMNSAAQKIEGHFPAGTSVDDGYDTEALATIWEKPEEFRAAHELLVERTAEMMRLAEAGDSAAIEAYVKELGGACKNCHDNFRLDTD
ncbi:MAG: cytochrome c [Erythrobacter sp.]|jgi:cytochrome c556|nr:cytochrome c [Erythrobacter sp.]